MKNWKKSRDWWGMLMPVPSIRILESHTLSNLFCVMKPFAIPLLWTEKHDTKSPLSLSTGNFVMGMARWWTGMVGGRKIGTSRTDLIIVSHCHDHTKPQNSDKTQ
jgi:hypothetical protein